MMLVMCVLCFLARTPMTGAWAPARGRLPKGVLGRSVLRRRGGAELKMMSSPKLVYDGLFGGLALAAVAAKVANKNDKTVVVKERNALGDRFLPVFWLLRAADWLQGPYFYEVYASKVSTDVVAKLFLAGFGSTAICGPFVGRLTDRYGRKAGTLVFSVVYAMAALTTRSNDLKVLFLGRVLSGIGTALLFSAPEAWLVGEAKRTNSTTLGATFGSAYGGDALVAIGAGQLASLAAYFRGPTGPFELSVLFLIFGFCTAALRWTENVATPDSSSSSKTGIATACRVILNDKRILLVGGVQALFEGAMFIFVLQWPPAVTTAVRAFFGSAAVPFGKVFSCFMVCCLLGSTFFAKLQSQKVPEEKTVAGLTILATIAMASATLATKATAAFPLMSLGALTAAFFAFEFCVGLYFPSIGTLRAKYVPDAHRSVIMNLFGIPLNAIVVATFLSIKHLGIDGALGVATSALGLASLSMATLVARNKKEEATIVPAL